MRATPLLMLLLSAGPALAQTTAAPTATAAPAATVATTTTLSAEAPVTAAPTMLKPAPPAASDGTTPRQRLVTVFGTEACPKPSSPDEIVVCARLPDVDVYRIPKPLRQADKRVSPLQTNRNLLLGDVAGGAGGSIGSCSANGPGGMIGCDRRMIDAWAQDRTNRMGTDEKTPR